MALIKTTLGRRSFIKTSALAGGGLMIGFSWLASCAEEAEKKEMDVLEMPKEWFEINGFIKIGENGVVTIMSTNPEIGQNVRTSMPMIVAEELDVDWKNVIVEQAPLNTKVYDWSWGAQIAGGSQSIRQAWFALRKAGLVGRHLLMQAAANAWQVPMEELSTEAGTIHHKGSGKSAHYGEMASAAAQLEVPAEFEHATNAQDKLQKQIEGKVKNVADFKIIGTSRKNVDGKKIVTGQPLFGLDVQKEGMLIAMMIHPPAFGKRFKSMNADSVKSMPGIRDVFTIQSYPEDMIREWSDVSIFDNLVVLVGDSTWQVLQAKNSLKVEWEDSPVVAQKSGSFGGGETIQEYPAGLESTSDHLKAMEAEALKPGKVDRKDGDVEAAFKNAAKILERTYTAPFLAHNTMEPMNFYANVQGDQVELLGPIQTPASAQTSVSKRLNVPKENISVQMTRMGGGFGRRLYGNFVVEAAVISQKIGAPVKLVYTREDDMTFGTYRPTYLATFKAGLDENNNLIALKVKAGGIPESPLFADRFPASAVENYLAESWTLESNVTTGAWRAPRSNFMAGAEQSFLDEVAELAGKDPIDFRLELLDRAKNNPVGNWNIGHYDPERYAGVLKLVKETSGWSTNDSARNRGVAAYFCHNSYVAQVMDIEMKEGKPVIEKVYNAVDCGIVVNPIAATNMVEGGLIDGIGHAMYSAMTFNNGVPEQSNFDRYRLIRHSEAPKEIKVDFVKSDIDPTGLGEPPLPPVIGALANAMYKATGRRYYNQPFISDQTFIG
ncbi:molybdopterin cofactor-binding domain-containing protein [Aegicerativicinus sediminis]